MCVECAADAGEHCPECFECFTDVDPCEDDCGYCVDCCQCEDTAVLSGTVASFGSENDDIVISLTLQGEDSPAYTTTVKGNNANYVIPEVVFGTYTVTVSKADHVTKEYTVDIYNPEMLLDLEIYQYGDVDSNGRIDLDDVVALLRHVSRAQVIRDPYQLAAGEIVDDGALNLDDVVKLLRYVSRAIPELK